MSSREPKFHVLTITLVVLTALAALGYVLRQQEQLNANRLRSAQSAYLRKSMHQLVDWLEWSPEAFTRAREQRKPIFLDMGASWSHECNVMGRENYDDPDIADIINQQFVGVKVDVDARPELLRRYEIERQLKFPGHAQSLPQIMILSPDGDVLYAPQADSKNRFRDALNRIVDELTARREQAFKQATDFRPQVDSAIRPIPGQASLAMIGECRSDLEKAFDTVNGGFRGAGEGKQLRPAALEFLLTRYVRVADPGARMMALQTLDALCLSGMFDHLHGGFFHASASSRWDEPQFSKLLSENAQMLRICALAYAISPNPLYKDAAYGAARYMVDNLWDETSGAFWSSEAADTDRFDDGSYYTWTLRQASDVLDDQETRAARLYFGIPSDGAPGSARYSLRIKMGVGELAREMGIADTEAARLLASATEKMLASRPKKDRPPIDKTVYAHLNGIAIHAFASAYRVFKDPFFRDHAVGSMNVLRTQFLAADGTVYHMKGPNQMMATGWLDDQIWTARAALDVFQITGEPALLRLAKRLMSSAIDRYANAAGGFYDLPNVNSPAGVILRLHMAVKDYPLPASNAIVANVLDDLSAFTGDPSWSLVAASALDAVAGTAEQLGIEACAYTRAVQRHLSPPYHAVIVGDPDLPQTQAMVNLAMWQNPVRVSVALLRPEDAPAVYGPRGGPTAYLCHGRTCLPPITSVAAFRAALAKPISP